MTLADDGDDSTTPPCKPPSNQANIATPTPTQPLLTEEQKERIRKNKERAQALRRNATERRKRQLDDVQSTCSVPNAESSAPNKPNKRAHPCNDKGNDGDKNNNDDVEDDVVLEDFEIGAAPRVTKKEAMSMYCLPEATLQVCSFVTKENPHRKGWSSMKLYDRSEIRRRARARHGGLEGLAAERKKREQKRFEKVLEQTKDVFQRR
uniref:XPA C-terminal domain-containing protein n=1 Tax=Leptocylindrus danicus TaxID=163516 RepID=A0A7S2PT66_9STRA|mmetsp:Transcript_9891/g.14814  ORF Transcript_9891/g.14814 Transcript_9891/m.14814 type:complete len:207 (+) Transcript_9891:16-636(+)